MTAIALDRPRAAVERAPVVEGLFLATLTGPGKVWLQSMPIMNLAEAIAGYLPSERVADVGVGAGVGAGIGRVVVGGAAGAAIGGVLGGILGSE